MSLEDIVSAVVSIIVVAILMIPLMGPGLQLRHNAEKRDERNEPDIPNEIYTKNRKRRKPVVTQGKVYLPKVYVITEGDKYDS